jgi:exodeoxyribonuclease-3
LWVFCAINYHLATDGLASLARTASIYKAEKFSDHALLTIGYDFKL